MSADARRETVRQWLTLAHRALAAARANLPQEAWEAAVNRAYYAAFYAAKALLASRDLDVKKHSGAASLVGQAFVTGGLLPPEAGRALQKLLAARIEADYDPTASFTADIVAGRIEMADGFISQAERLLREEGWLSD